jgi:hypothetical protein
MIILKENKEPFQEKLVPATDSEFNRLQAEIAKNPKLKKQLDTPLDDLPQYKYLYNQDYVGRMTLFGILDIIGRKEKKSTLYFSKAGNNFTGFIVYVDNGRVIDKIKMASFYDDAAKANRQMADDLKAFIGEKMKTHAMITWEAEKENPANMLYQKAVPLWYPQYGFTFSWDKKIQRMVYKVFKK